MCSSTNIICSHIIERTGTTMHQQKSYDEFVTFPELATSNTSLSILEKSLFGHILLLNHPQTVIELGVYHGMTTRFICNFLSANAIDAKVYGFDLPEIIAERRQEEQLQAWEQSNQLELMAGSLPESLRTWLKKENPTIDVALVDARHTYGAVLDELTLLWDNLADDGYIICHDYNPHFKGIQYAVDYFVRTHGANMLPLYSSKNATDAGQLSSIAVLAKPVYNYNKLDQLNHHLRNRLRFVKEWFQSK